MDEEKYFPTLYQEFIHLSRYARWVEEEGRRETWEETVDRFISYMVDDKCSGKIDETTRAELRNGILQLEVMPSMRCLMTAGAALKRDEASGYNCAYVAIDDIAAFDEMLYLLMCGTGVGFSVERQFIDKLPAVAERLRPSKTVITVEDSKLGWANAYREMVSMLFQGRIPSWDVSQVRGAGARLKTFGGRASGPAPLVDLFRFTIGTFKEAAGRKLNSLECHDLACKIGEIVVVGGVRRSALISLSNPSDDRMRHAKTGEWWNHHPHRALANNSACYTEKPEAERFIREWLALIESKSGERGVFNRQAAKKVVERNGRRDVNHEFGCNPCSEILLRSCGFCNLSEVVVRHTDTIEDVERKVELATILGTMQSTLTDFRYLRNVWRQNAEEECLLGVSLTGVMDHPLFSGREGKRKLGEALDSLRERAIEVNKKWSKKLGINQSVAITCNKPSGCRPWDSLVTTDEGILTLEELFGNHHYGSEWGDYIDGASAVIEDVKSTPITKTYVNGESPVLEVELNFGLTVRSTPNHKWFVKKHKSTSWTKKVDEWKRVDELVPGDIIETNIGNYRNDVPSRMKGLTSQAIRMREDAFEIRQPEEMTEDLAWFIGYLWGDGAQSPCKYRIRFTEEHEDIISRVSSLVTKLFGIECDYFRAHDDRNAWQLEVASKMLWHWLIKNDIWKYYADELDIIPEVVRRSSWRHIVAFIGGMVDSDGWVNEVSGGNIKTTITCSYDMLSRHLQQVAWSVGLCLGRSHNVKGENFQEQKSMYLMCLCGNTDREAMECLAANSVKHGRFPDGNWHAINCTKTQIPGKVKGVKVVGIMPTFDIETECHWFYDGAVKSHNTVSQLVDCASGIHPRFSRHYIRTVRADKKDPLAQLMADMGFPCEPDVTKPNDNLVFSFPMKTPDTAVLADEMGAMEQLEMWRVYQRHWTEHKPSCTVYVRDHEWLEVGAWVHKNFDEISGISFLPFTGHTYKQAPYQEISEEEYVEWLDMMPVDVDWSLLKAYEVDDSAITAHKEYACVGGKCENVDMIKSEEDSARE